MKLEKAMFEKRPPNDARMVLDDSLSVLARTDVKLLDVFMYVAELLVLISS